MAVMPSSCERSGTSSTSILMKRMSLFSSRSESLRAGEEVSQRTRRLRKMDSFVVPGATHFSRMGEIILQGPHHSAKQSRTTTLCCFRVSWNSSLLDFGSQTSVPGRRCCAHAWGGEEGGAGTHFLTMWITILGELAWNCRATGVLRVCVVRVKAAGEDLKGSNRNADMMEGEPDGGGEMAQAV